MAPPAERPAPSLDPEAVYFVESVGREPDPTALLARRAALREGWLGWDDTSRDRLHRVVQARRDGETTVVECENGFAYRFRPLTLALYDAHVKAKVELSPAFASTTALWEFYRRAVF